MRRQFSGLSAVALAATLFSSVAKANQCSLGNAVKNMDGINSARGYIVMDNLCPNGTLSRVYNTPGSFWAWVVTVKNLNNTPILGNTFQNNDYEIRAIHKLPFHSIPAAVILEGADPNTVCTGPGMTATGPLACCTGALTGNCHANSDCTGLDTPRMCCTGSGTGTCIFANRNCIGPGNSTLGQRPCCTDIGEGSCNTAQSSQLNPGGGRDCLFARIDACTIAPNLTKQVLSVYLDHPVNSGCSGPNVPWPCCTGGGAGSCNAGGLTVCPTYMFPAVACDEPPFAEDGSGSVAGTCDPEAADANLSDCDGAGGPDACQGLANGAVCGPFGCYELTECEAGVFQYLGKRKNDGTTCATQANCDGVPAVSEWGLIALTMMMLVAGTVVLRQRMPLVG